MKTSLKSIKGVTQVHSLRLWSLTVDLLAANVHLQIGKFILDLQTFHGDHLSGIETKKSHYLSLKCTDMFSYGNPMTAIMNTYISLTLFRADENNSLAQKGAMIQILNTELKSIYK